MNKPTSLFRAVVVAAALTGLAACASGARPAQMAASPGAIAPLATGAPGYKAFRVAAVQGGSGTNPLWMSNVSDTDFTEALKASLQAVNYLADTPEQAKAEIAATLIDLKRPLVGLDLTVTTRVQYRAKNVSDAKTVLDETVTATGKAGVGDAFIAVERLRLANEASIKANIETFLKRLGEVLSAKP